MASGNGNGRALIERIGLLEQQLAASDKTVDALTFMVTNAITSLIESVRILNAELLVERSESGGDTEPLAQAYKRLQALEDALAEFRKPPEE